jgi:hypothetical protein
MDNKSRFHKMEIINDKFHNKFEFYEHLSLDDSAQFIVINC